MFSSPFFGTHNAQMPSACWKRLLVLAAVIAPLSAPGATEQPPPATNAPTANAPQSLPPVVVSAPALIQGNEVNAYGGESTVVTRRQIEDLNTMDIGSTLRTVPGVTISRHNIAGSYGGAGGGAIFVRGLGASRPGGDLVTLYDGVPRYNAVFSHPLLDVLSTDAADALRVYKGVQPQVFGNAFAAIDISPRQAPIGSGDGFGGEVFGAYGTHDTVVESITAGGRVGAFDIAAGQSFRRSSGHRANSGGELQDYFTRLGYALSENWALSFSGDHTNNYAEDPGPQQGSAGWPYHMGNYRTNDWMGVFTLSNTYEKFDGHIKPYWNSGYAEWLDQGKRGSNGGLQPPGGGSTDVTSMHWDNYGVRARERIRPWSGTEIIVGVDVDILSGKADSSNYAGAVTKFKREELEIYSPYVAISHLFGSPKKQGFYVQPSAGLRFYAHNIFDSEWSPHTGVVAGYKDTELHASYARGVNYPGLNVAVLSRLTPIYNNPAARDGWQKLDAETMDHFEIGIQHRFTPEIQAEVTGFYDSGRDRYMMLAALSGPPLPVGFANVADYHNYGVEASVTWTPFADLSFFAGATWLHTSVKGMPYAPEWSASAGVTWRFLKNFRLSVDVTFQDHMYVNPDNAFDRAAATNLANNPQVKSALVLNAKVAYEFDFTLWVKAHGEVFLAFENVTDHRYYYRPGYPLPGFGGMLGVKFGF
ncbi:MAG: TonB-dependent receptor plug domain-containing protein [Puniceicoccales bacterium]|nr:TonB-dependent receptor plug domain-containing protein [Puniceicoccales bacterium]